MLQILCQAPPSTCHPNPHSTRSVPVSYPPINGTYRPRRALNWCLIYQANSNLIQFLDGYFPRANTEPRLLINSIMGSLTNQVT